MFDFLNTASPKANWKKEKYAIITCPNLVVINGSSLAFSMFENYMLIVVRRSRTTHLDVHFCGKLAINRGVNCCLKTYILWLIKLSSLPQMHHDAHHIYKFLFLAIKSLRFCCRIKNSLRLDQKQFKHIPPLKFHSHFDTNREKKVIKKPKVQFFFLSWSIWRSRERLDVEDHWTLSFYERARTQASMAKMSKNHKILLSHFTFPFMTHSNCCCCVYTAGEIGMRKKIVKFCFNFTQLSLSSLSSN